MVRSNFFLQALQDYAGNLLQTMRTNSSRGAYMQTTAYHYPNTHGIATLETVNRQGDGIGYAQASHSIDRLGRVLNTLTGGNLSSISRTYDSFGRTVTETISSATGILASSVKLRKFIILIELVQHCGIQTRITERVVIFQKLSLHKVVRSILLEETVFEEYYCR